MDDARAERMRQITVELEKLGKHEKLTGPQELAYHQLRREWGELERAQHLDELRAAIARPGTTVESGTPTTSPDGGLVEERQRRLPSRGGGLALTRDETLHDWATRRGAAGRPADRELSFDAMVRGLATGDWRGADAEQRAITETPLTAGGHLVPTPVALDVIDRARASARVLQAGATVVPMTAQTLKYPRLVSEATPAWRLEGATINDQAMTFDAVTLTAQSLAVLVKCSWELFEDAAPGSRVIEHSFAQTIALELDRVLLRGSGTAPEPRGLRNTTGITVTAFGGANGAAPTNYDPLLDALQVLRTSNFEPNGIIHAPRTETTLAKLKDTQNAYLIPPTQLATIPRYASNQVPTNLTTGTSTDTSESYVGEWGHLLFGVRTNLAIQFLQERFADQGMYAFLAHLRADVAVAQPAAFNVVAGIRP